MPKSEIKRRIQPVNNSFEKQITYRENLIRYEKAIRNGFYFECLVIDYACLEDRLRSMLYYLGVLRSETDYKVEGHSARVEAFRKIFRDYEGEKANLSISGISGKIKIAKSVLCMVERPDGKDSTNQIASMLWKVLHDDPHCEETLKILNEIQEWCKYRNEVIHSLLNKNPDSLNERIESQAKSGYRLFRRLDNQVQWVKRKRIREKMQLNDRPSLVISRIRSQMYTRSYLLVMVKCQGGDEEKTNGKRPQKAQKALTLTSPGLQVYLGSGSVTSCCPHRRGIDPVVFQQSIDKPNQFRAVKARAR